MSCCHNKILYNETNIRYIEAKIRNNGELQQRANKETHETFGYQTERQ